MMNQRIRYRIWIPCLVAMLAAPCGALFGQSNVAAVLRSDALPSPEQLAQLPGVLPEKAASLLREVKVPEGFDATIFATPPAVNYPVFLAAAPDGTLYVSSDGNGSLGRDPNRGRVLRVRDLDGDGHADEVKAFVPNVDSPRGLVWDHDRLYLLHPPHLSVYRDTNGDGVADEQKILVKNIAFGFKDRPADHTSNGIDLGIDGWIYCAIGDFGFMAAEGTDGRILQLRGGGVVRVRPDGTGMEIFSRGTRNILEVALSPLLDGFARDNTNDGGGWDIRLHHFTGRDDHGYPRLFINFADEIVQPLADYGGGSGCGAVWIDEPGIPAAWNNAPITADWGRNWAYHHAVEPVGATFRAGQKEFVSVPRVTDLDVDGMSSVYVASWKGATFNWAGNDVGYVVRLTPKGFKPEPLPLFEPTNSVGMLATLKSSSHRRRLAAQRALLRGNLEAQTATELRRMVTDPAISLASRVAALFTLQQAGGPTIRSELTLFTTDPVLQPWSLRALGELPSAPRASAEAFLAGLQADDARTRKEAVLGLGRLGHVEHGTALVPRLTDPDAVVRHTTMQVMRELKATEACWPVLDTAGATEAERAGVLRVLQEIQEPSVVSGIKERLERTAEPAQRKLLLTALCRLHYQEGVWKGASWGTRPDTRGPYYTPEPWSGTENLGQFLKEVLNRAPVPEAVFLATECLRHRIDPEGSLDKLVGLAANHPEVVPVVVEHVARATAVPASARELLSGLAAASATTPELRAGAIQGLARAEFDAASLSALLKGLVLAHRDLQNSKLNARAAESFFSSSQLEKQTPLLMTEAARLNRAESVWADAALIRIVDRAKPNNKTRGVITSALDEGWNDLPRRRQLIEASLLAEKKVLGEKILAAAEEGDADTALLARKAVQRLKLEEGGVSRGRLVGTSSVDRVLEGIAKLKGDVPRGERIFTQVGCNACHTVKADEPVKGPFLGNIASIYKRRELAEAILLPNKTIAQGFATHRFEFKDGEELDGFVVQEAAEQVTIRTVAAQEVKIATTDIAHRRVVPQSLMPEGLMAAVSVEDFASLLTFLESLAATP